MTIVWIVGVVVLICSLIALCLFDNILGAIVIGIITAFFGAASFYVYKLFMMWIDVDMYNPKIFIPFALLWSIKSICGVKYYGIFEYIKTTNSKKVIAHRHNFLF